MQLQNHFVVIYVTNSHFYHMSQRTITSKVAKMVDLEKNHKHMSWNGQDSL
jgi:hypothetical protein